MTEEKKARYTGKIIFIARKKGYGFVSTPDIPFTRIFFHWSELHPVHAKHFTELRIQDEVTFEVEEISKNNLKAIKINSAVVVEDDVQGKV